MSMLYFHCHIVISSSLKYAVFIISYVALYHFQSKITIGTFHIFVRQNCTHLTIFVRFYLLYFDQSVQKKAKPALCFARIAKAILGGITPHYEQFPIRIRVLKVHFHDGDIFLKICATIS